MSYNQISFDIEDEIALIGFGKDTNLSMPIMNEECLRELRDCIEDVSKRQKSEIKGLIIHSHNDKAFMAGADINLIASMTTESEAAAGAETGQNIFNLIEDLKIPVIACVHGVCLGGGCELILSCDRIYVSDAGNTQIGLPEVQLGFIPGFGGTYRLPKRVGLPNALDMILSGKKILGKKAKKMGLANEVYPKENLLRMAKLNMFKKDKSKSLQDNLQDFAVDNFVTRKMIFSKARESVMKKTKGFYQAPLKILEVMEEGYGKGRSTYLSMEAQAFGELCMGSQSQNLQHIFFLMDNAKKYRGPKGEGEKTVVTTGGVLGAGTMGGGIAWLFADNGFSPIMKDIGVEALELGLKQASSNFKGAVKRRKMTPFEFEKKQRSITPTLSFDGFKNIDLLIEAIVENMEIKKKVFAETENYMRDDAIITSNTSSLSIEEMSQALKRPERFAGLHFFNPVHRMPLVEIITHSKVSPETLEVLYKWCLKVKKTPIIVKDGPGFLVNRILMPYMNEAMFLLEEGVDFKTIETACTNFGMPMGPFRLMDEVGIDVGAKVAKIIYDGLGERLKSSELGGKIAESGLLGKKNSKGFYTYDEAGKESGFNEDVKKFFPSNSKSMDETSIQMRIFLPMINEASFILDEKIVDKAETVDLGMIFGTGFPPFRGGLCKYADNEGLERIVNVMKDFASSVNADRYTPSPLLEKMIAEKIKFYDL